MRFKSRIQVCVALSCLFLTSSICFAKSSGPLQAEILVSTSDRLGTIDRNIYGLFSEMCFYEFNGGMWAEMLKSRKFAGDDGENGNYGVVRPWFAMGRDEQTFFMHDNTTYYTGIQSQKIVSKNYRKRTSGIGQDGLCIEAGKEYEVRLNLKQSGIEYLVVVCLRAQDNTIYAREAIDVPVGEWTTTRLKLRPKESDTNARFTINFAGKGTLWVGSVSLMPADNMEGFRKDVVEALKALNLPNMRWPGGNMVSEYHWADAIGDRDKRPPRFIRGLWDPFDVGIDEFIKLCRLIDAEPYIAVNAGDGTPEEAAALVEYCNGDLNTKFGQMRARKSGSRAPYKIKLWGIGNEMFGNWQNGHVDEETYAARHAAIAKAMLAVDKDIKIVATGGRYWKYPRWNQALFEIAGDYFDYLSLHSYAKKYRRTMKKKDLEDKKFAEEFYYYIVSSPYGVEEQIYETGKEIRAALPNRPDIKVAFDEWNCWAYIPPGGDVESEKVDFAERDALYTAGMFHAFRRQHNAVTLANFSKTVNAMPLIKVKQCGIFYNPQYLAFDLYLNHCGQILLKTDVKCDSYPAPEYEKGRPQAVGNIKYLDASTTASEDGKTIYVAVINLHIDKTVKTKILFDKWDFSPTVKTYEIYHEDYMAENTFENPNNLSIKQDKLTVATNNFTYTFKPHSVTVMEFVKK